MPPAVVTRPQEALTHLQEVEVFNAGMNRTSGVRIEDLEAHVKQSIADIVTTPIGSRVMRRDYGSLIPALIDQPLDRSTVLRLYAATAASIMRWEPRLKISRIQLQYVEPAGALIEVSGLLDGRVISSQARIGGGR